MKLVRVRIKASGQVVDLIPNVAEAMLRGNTAERLDPEPAQPESAATTPGQTLPPSGQAETAAIDPAAGRAVSPKQNAPKKKKRFHKT